MIIIVLLIDLSIPQLIVFSFVSSIVVILHYIFPFNAGVAPTLFSTSEFERSCVAALTPDSHLFPLVFYVRRAIIRLIAFDL